MTSNSNLNSQEKIIEKLEEIDLTFSEISKNLKILHKNMLQIKLNSSKMSINLENLKNLFDSKNNKNFSNKKFDEESQNQESSNKNINCDRNEMFEDNTFCKTGIENETSSVLNSSFNEFDNNDLPEIFKNDQNVEKIYNFIKKYSPVKIQSIYDKFSNLSDQKVDIYFYLLISKRVIKVKSGLAYVK